VEGTLLAGRFRIERLLGRGGMGEVYEAVQLDLSRRVAIKVLPAEAGDLHAIEREARAAARLAHPHIVQVTDFVGVREGEDGVPFFVMELLEGESLAERLARERRLAPSRAALVAVQVLSALAAAHAAGIVHRDVKPANIFLERTAATHDFVKLLDFGIARLSTGAGPTSLRSGALVGTPAYMAPEQITAEGVSERTDLYAVGVCLYEMLAGGSPFTATNVPALLTKICEQAPKPIDGIDATLGAIVLRAMAKRPEDRWASAEEMRVALVPFAGSAPVPSRAIDGGGARSAERPESRLGGVGGRSPMTVSVDPLPRISPEREAMVTVPIEAPPPPVAAEPVELLVPLSPPPSPRFSPVDRTLGASQHTLASEPVSRPEPPSAPVQPHVPVWMRQLFVAACIASVVWGARSGSDAPPAPVPAAPSASSSAPPPPRAPAPPFEASCAIEVGESLETNPVPPGRVSLASAKGHLVVVVSVAATTPGLFVLVGLPDARVLDPWPIIGFSTNVAADPVFGSAATFDAGPGVVAIRRRKPVKPRDANAALAYFVAPPGQTGLGIEISSGIIDLDVRDFAATAAGRTAYSASLLADGDTIRVVRDDGSKGRQRVDLSKRGPVRRLVTAAGPEVVAVIADRSLVLTADLIDPRSPVRRHIAFPTPGTGDLGAAVLGPSVVIVATSPDAKGLQYYVVEIEAFGAKDPDIASVDASGILLSDHEIDLTAIAAVPGGLLIAWREGKKTLRVGKALLDRLEWAPEEIVTIPTGDDPSDLAIAGGAEPAVAWTEPGKFQRDLHVAPLRCAK
jgi:serine/threonine-protein kinase